MEFRFRNVNDAYARMVPWLVENGIKTPSRNGPVLRAPEPVTWTLEHPWERVLLDPYRDVNPFFHIYEGLWMIHGANAVRPLCHFVKRMVDFTDNGATVPGAYGYRWQNKVDQWRPALATLANDPGSRRVVLAMYDPKQDTKALVSGGKDIPCNTHMYLTIREGRLCMTVLNRSNDIEWGALGANAVHFSMVHEWAADILNVAEGPLTVFSNDLHKYIDRKIPAPPKVLEPYQEFGIGCIPMQCQTVGWARDLKRGGPSRLATQSRLRHPVVPGRVQAYDART